MVDGQELRAALRAARVGGSVEVEVFTRDFLFPLAAQATASLRDEDEDGFDDVVQAAVIAMYRVLHRVNMDGNPYSYLRNVARNAAVSELNRRRRWQARHLSLNAIELDDV